MNVASPNPSLTARSRRRRLVELALLFFVLPVLLAVLRRHLPFLVIPMIAVGGLAFGLLLTRDPSFDQRAFLSVVGLGRHLRAILCVFVPAAAAISAGVWFFDREEFLFFPRYAPRFWPIIMVFYPLVGATFQEVVFRGYFFHRFGPLFARPSDLILVNAVSFALFHVFFGNYVAPALSLAGGLLFAYRYHKTGSLFAVAIEHGLWGDFLFTVGLGRFLFSGAIH